MDLAELVNAMRVVELSAKTRHAAIRSLAQAALLDDDDFPLDTLVQAVEEREATAQTIVDKGLAMPHAVVDWDGDFRIALGRSRTGVDYGVSDSGLVHLIALFFVGRRSQKEFHLQLLAALAKLLDTEEFRKQIIESRDVRAIEQLLLGRAGLTAKGRPRRVAGVPRINAILCRQAIELVQILAAQAVLVAVDKVESVPWDTFAEWPGLLLVVTTQKKGEDVAIERPNTHFFDVPHATLTRMDRANLGLLLAASEGLLSGDATVVCVTGPGRRRLDSVTVTKPESQLEAMFGAKTTRRSAAIRPAVILRALALAIELSSEGREGKPIGAMFVIGDTRHVMRHTRQLVLNPFHGYTRALRNLLDPSLAETIKEFAQLDGAFIVQADGMVLSAGTYLIPKSTSVRLPAGLGARHQAGAAITAHTQAMAITVSHSTGTVTVFRGGQILLQLERATSIRG